MKGVWHGPARITEPAGKQLGSFGITSVPGARTNMVDPPSMYERAKEGVKKAFGMGTSEATEEKKEGETPADFEKRRTEEQQEKQRNPYQRRKQLEEMQGE